MKLLDVITELFGSDVYPVNVIEDKEYDSRFTGQPLREIRYEFITKDQVVYHVGIEIWKTDKVARLDFYTSSKTPGHSSIIELINTHDAIKVFNTLKSILEKHKQEFQKLIIDSDPDRIKFYEKLLQYFHVNFEKKNNHYLIATF
jgi:hypothetical protein